VVLGEVDLGEVAGIVVRRLDFIGEETVLEGLAVALYAFDGGREVVRRLERVGDDVALDVPTL
jgi:hypothetical protein